MVGLQDYEVDLLLVPHTVRCPPLPAGFSLCLYQAFQLLGLFRDNFKKFEAYVGPDVLQVAAE